MSDVSMLTAHYEKERQALLSCVDHLVYATTELDRGIADIERLLGVRAIPGGRHPMWGTWNALVALGPASYLEVIAADPGQSPASGARPFGLDRLSCPRLVAWAAKTRNFEQLRVVAARSGVALGNALSASRQRPDGTMLSWTLTDPCRVLGDGIVPFYIDWGHSSHPASTAPSGATLAALTAEHPDPDRMRDMIHSLGLALPVAIGPEPALIAEINCSNGRVLLR
jgi:Glyoxalase-like domain